MRKHHFSFSCLLVLTLFFYPSSAEETILSNAEQVYTGTTFVSLTIEEKYTVTIPPSIPITYGTEQTDLTVGVTDLDLTQGYSLRVAVESPEGALQQTDGDGRIPYALKDANGLFGETITRETGEIPLTVNISQRDWFAAPAGNYEGQITFSVSAGKYTAEGGN